MPTKKQPSRPDGFDILREDQRHSTHLYEDHDTELREVLRPWPQLSAQGKLSYIASAAAMYNVPFERFALAAREDLGGQALPAGEHDYLRIHIEYQRALAVDRHHGVLTAKFYRLLDDYLNDKQHFTDTDGQSRRWPQLSPVGKVEHIARLAAIFDQPLSRFAEAVHDALDGQTLRTDEHACLELYYRYARQLRDPSPHLLPQPHSTGIKETAPSHNPWLGGSIDPMLTELEAFGDQFERLARSGEQRQLAVHFKDWIHHTNRVLFVPIAQTLADKLFSAAMSQQPKSPPEASQRAVPQHEPGLKR